MRKGDNLVLYSCMRDGVIVAKSIFQTNVDFINIFCYTHIEYSIIHI